MCSLGSGKDIVFVSSFDVDGAVTQAGADKLCLDAARSANLAGHYDAWLSYQQATPQGQQQINAVDRLRDPIVPPTTTTLNLVNGTLIANSLDLLVQTQGTDTGMVYSNGISRTEWNDPRPGPNGVPGATVYTGTSRTGTLAVNPNGLPNTCMNWTNDTGQVSAETGISNTGKPDWTEHTTNTCDNNTFALYCFSAPEPIAFVTSQPTFLGDGLGSIASADAFCNQLAARGMPGKYFHAWISDSTIDARKRIPNRAYFLRNGKRVAQSIADLIDGTIESPININEGGTQVTTGTTAVWTGTNSAGIASGDCSDWTPSGSQDGTQGALDKNSAAWTDASLVLCNGSARLYCFQIN
jgi:hypothetical protein